MLHISKHKELLESVVELVERRALEGRCTVLHKVKSHIGINGNEKADQAAGAVANGTAPADARWVSEPACNTPFSKLFWLQRTSDDFFVSDLNVGIKKAVLPHTQNGYTQPTLYTEGWAGTAPLLCPNSSHRLHTDSTLPWSAVLNGMKVRHGTLWNAKLAQRCKRPLVTHRHGRPLHRQAISDGRCPACGHEDGTGHIMGGCTHQRMKALYIQRHNHAVQLVAKAISKGDTGGGYIVMDANAAEDTPEYSAGTRLPRWLLPRRLVSDAELNKLRPDLLVIPTIPLARGVSGRGLPTTPEGRHRHTVYIVEVGYTHDTRHEAKTHEKAEQHARLAELLAHVGWRVQYTRQEALSLGVGGSISKAVPDILRTLGVRGPAVAKCCNRLHTHALTTGLAIVCCRRELERSNYPGRRPRPGEPPP